MGSKYDVFISYRRDVSIHQARSLLASLEYYDQYKDRVFMDTHTLKSGNFIEELNRKLYASNNFVVIFSKGCFDQSKKESGKMDYFLYEISQALKYGKNVIPIYYDGVVYDDIKAYLHEDGLIDFPKQNAIFYHNDDPDGSVAQIISFLKSEETVLSERYSNLSKERNLVRQELLLLHKDVLDLKCPICNKSYSAIQSYCSECGYKFFDSLEESIAETSDLLQESDRKKKHKALWQSCLNRVDRIAKQHSNPVVDNNQEKISQLEADVDEKASENRELKIKNKELQNEINQLKKQIKASETELVILNNKLIEARQSKSNEMNKNHSLEIRIRQLEGQLNNQYNNAQSLQNESLFPRFNSKLEERNEPYKQIESSQKRSKILEHEWHQLIRDCRKDNYMVSGGSGVFSSDKVNSVLDITKLINELQSMNVNAPKEIVNCNRIEDLKQLLVNSNS